MDNQNIENIEIINKDEIQTKILNLINKCITHFNDHHVKYKLKFNNIEIIDIKYVENTQNVIIDKGHIEFILKVTKKNIIEHVTIKNRRIIKISGIDDGEEYEKTSHIYCLPTILNYCGLIRFENNKYKQCVHYHNQSEKNINNNEFICLGCYKCDDNECKEYMEDKKLKKIRAPIKRHENYNALLLIKNKDKKVENIIRNANYLF